MQPGQVGLPPHSAAVSTMQYDHSLNAAGAPASFKQNHPPEISSELVSYSPQKHVHARFKL